MWPPTIRRANITHVPCLQCDHWQTYRMAGSSSTATALSMRRCVHVCACACVHAVYAHARAVCARAVCARLFVSTTLGSHPPPFMDGAVPHLVPASRQRGTSTHMILTAHRAGTTATLQIYIMDSNCSFFNRGFNLGRLTNSCQHLLKIWSRRCERFSCGTWWQLLCHMPCGGSSIRTPSHTISSSSTVITTHDSSSLHLVTALIMTPHHCRPLREQKQRWQLMLVQKRVRGAVFCIATTRWHDCVLYTCSEPYSALLPAIAS